jgi:hypothetical protein
VQPLTGAFELKNIQVEQEEEKNIEDQENLQEDDDNFIQDFIDRKKLENRVLQEMIDKLTQTGHKPEESK